MSDSRNKQFVGTIREILAREPKTREDFERVRNAAQEAVRTSWPSKITKNAVADKWVRQLGYNSKNGGTKAVDDATWKFVSGGIPITEARWNEFLKFINDTTLSKEGKASLLEELARQRAVNFGSLSGVPLNKLTVAAENQFAESGEPELAKWLRCSSNLVLEGVPGTGKTHAINALKVAYDDGGKPVPGTGIANLPAASGRDLPQAGGTLHVAVEVRFMTMHPSTSYEDFVEGLRPAGDWTNAKAAKKVTDGKSTDPQPGPWFHEETSSPTTEFALKNGFFVEACVAAVADPDKAVVVVLDELNRCNIPKVLGDLMTVIEESKRAHWDETKTAWVVDNVSKAVTLPYSGRKLFVPDNLFIIGTMNTTDRSVAPMDAALRRRFSFHRLWPQGFGPDAALTRANLEQRVGNTVEMKAALQLWREINSVLLARYGADAMLGHSYLDDLSRGLARDTAKRDEVVSYHWGYRILPQLMDVIASNGLTRSLTNSPEAFFSADAKQDDAAKKKEPPFNGQIRSVLSGTGSQKSAHLEFVRLTIPSMLQRPPQTGADEGELPGAAVVAKGADGDA